MNYSNQPAVLVGFFLLLIRSFWRVAFNLKRI